MALTLYFYSTQWNWYHTVPHSFETPSHLEKGGSEALPFVVVLWRVCCLHLVGKIDTGFWGASGEKTQLLWSWGVDTGFCGACGEKTHLLWSYHPLRLKLELE